MSNLEVPFGVVLDGPGKPAWLRPRHRAVLDALANGEVTQPHLIDLVGVVAGLPPNSVIRSARELAEHGLVAERREGPVRYRLAS